MNYTITNKPFFRFSFGLTFLFTLIVFNRVEAQELEAAVNLHTFADNREYNKSERFSQTIFGLRFSPEIGLRLDSTHRIRLGFNALHEFGSTKFTDKIDPVAYYEYQKQDWNFYMGVFPRHQLLSDFPRAVLKDTFNYYRPNVEGMLLKFENKNWRQLLFIDWTSRQTATARENLFSGFPASSRKIFSLFPTTQ